MGITLTYKPEPKPASEVAKTLIAESQKDSAINSWWSEPMCLMEVPGQGLLGMTKVFLPGYSTREGGYVEVEPAENYLMAWRDISRIAQTLSSWSKRYAVAWHLTLEGEQIGTISPNGDFSYNLHATLDQLLQMAAAPADPQARAERIGDIDRKYASRRE